MEGGGSGDRERNEEEGTGTATWQPVWTHPPSTARPRRPSRVTPHFEWGGGDRGSARTGGWRVTERRGGGGRVSSGDGGGLLLRDVSPLLAGRGDVTAGGGKGTGGMAATGMYVLYGTVQTK